MPEMNYSDAERRAYVTASPTAALLARIADLESEVERLRDENETLREQAAHDEESARSEGYAEGVRDCEATHVPE